MLLTIVVTVFVLGAVVLSQVYEYRHSPHCSWCNGRHYGRCIFNPRAGRIFANVNDGHFDVNDPNK